VIAPAPSVELHHGVPRCLLAMRDRADERTVLDGEGIQRWMDWECEVLRFGVDPDTPRNELAAMIDGSTAEITRQEHRELHAGDFARWGRRGGVATARRYGTAWMALLARRRWEKIGAEALAEAFAAINVGRA
jgi:hypothetical protein